MHYMMTTLLSMLALAASAQSAPDDGTPSDFNNLFSGSAGVGASSLNVVHALHEYQEQADINFQESRYDRAFDVYQVLAQHDDHF